MKLRSIIIIPKFKQNRQIQAMREKFDPLTKDSLPYIALIHPFNLEIRQKYLKENIKARLKNIKPFKIKLSKITKEDSHYLFLNISEGEEEIKKLHNVLYSRKLGTVMGERVEYNPCMIIGKFNSAVDIDKAYKELKTKEFNCEAYIDTVYIETIDIHNKNYIEFSVKI